MMADDFPAIARAAVVEGIDAGRAVAVAVAYSPRPSSPRASVPPVLAAKIYLRDHFVCRYCGRRTVLMSVIELLARLYPAEIPYVDHHLPAGRTHPAFTRLMASVDHIHPAALGGNRDPGNLVTACWPCNIAKSEFDLEFLGWRVRDIEDVAWAGLTEFYVPLWRLAGRPDPRRHTRWIRALGQAE